MSTSVEPSEGQRLADHLAQNPVPDKVHGTKPQDSPPQKAQYAGHPSRLVGLGGPQGWSQWQIEGNGRFRPGCASQPNLDPGLYSPNRDNAGLYLQQIDCKTDNLIRPPSSKIDEILQDVEQFWKKRSLFEEFGLTFKRGYLLWGPPGGGKTCIIQFVLQGIVSRGGVALICDHVGLFVDGLRAVRDLQPAVPVLGIIEDIDTVISHESAEAELLQLLDGTTSIDNIVYIATTNYPERLGPRILNRPSRFDCTHEIPPPSTAMRRLYLQRLAGGCVQIDTERFVKDTADFSMGHIKALFVDHVIQGKPYKQALANLQAMQEQRPHSAHPASGPVGFPTGLRSDN